MENKKEESMENKDLITLEPIDPKQAEGSITEATGILEKAKQYVIKTQEDYTHIAESLKIIKGKIKLITERQKALTSPINIAKARVLDLFRPALEAYSAAEVVAKQIMKTWDDEQDRKIAEQQEKLRKESEKKEQKTKERLEERAKKAEAEGNTDKADELRNKKEEVSIQAPVIAPREKTAGIHYKEIWRAEVMDKNIVPIEWLIPDQKALDKHAVMSKGQIPIPGVKFLSERVLSSRSS
jgi:hypothetical protein